MAQAVARQESWMAPEQSHPRSTDDPEPDVPMREAIAILYRARRIVASISGNEGEVEAISKALHKADAELGYAAWQVGTLKGQLLRERRAKAALQARLETLTEALHGRVGD
jgi:hypothetical protein